MEKVNSQKLHPDTAGYMKNFEKNFEEVFKKAMDFNIKIINQTASSSKKGVAPLIADYIVKNIMNPESITENTGMNLAYYYENREREYGLS